MITQWERVSIARSERSPNRALAFALALSTVRCMIRLGWACRVDGYFRVLSGIGLVCMMNVAVASCASDDWTDTAVNRSSDADDADDDRGNGNGDPDDEFTVERYYEALCGYYVRCSTVVSSYYGGKDQCLKYALGVVKTLPLENFEETLSAYLKPDCFRQLRSAACPSGISPEREAVEVPRIVYDYCVEGTSVPCKDDDGCVTGRCSAQEGECGVCEPLPEGQCRTSYDCALTQACVNEVCVPLAATGAACTSFEECASGRCTSSICIDVVQEGGSCTTSIDCSGYMGCREGQCALPASPGAACESGAWGRCQLGYACKEGTCQEVGYENVPIGGLCATSASCVVGAMCSSLSICEATGNECASDTHCPDGHYCTTLCQPKSELGEPCDSDRECKSAHCPDTKTCTERIICQ